MSHNSNIAFPEDLWERANILAVRKRITFTALVNEAVAQYCSGRYCEDIVVDERGRIYPPEAEAALRMSHE